MLSRGVLLVRSIAKHRRVDLHRCALPQTSTFGQKFTRHFSIADESDNEDEREKKMDLQMEQLYEEDRQLSRQPGEEAFPGDPWMVQGSLVGGTKVRRVHALWRKDPLRYTVEELGRRFGIRQDAVKGMLMMVEEEEGNVRNRAQFDVLYDEIYLAAADARDADAERKMASDELDVDTKFQFWQQEEEEDEDDDSEMEFDAAEGPPISAEYEVLEDWEDEEAVSRRLSRAEARRQRRAEYLLHVKRQVPTAPDPPLEFPAMDSASGAALPHNQKWKYMFVDISHSRDDRNMESLLVREPGSAGLRTATQVEERQWRKPQQFD